MTIRNQRLSFLKQPISSTLKLLLPFLKQAKTLIFNSMKAAFMKLKERASLVFLLNISCIISFYAFFFFGYCIMNTEPEWFVKILLIMAESSAIYFCFLAKGPLSRFQSLFSLFFSFLITLFILEKIDHEIFLYLFLPIFIFSFFLAKSRFFCPFDFLFLVVLLFYTSISYEIFFWDFFLIQLLLFVYIIIFLFRKEESTTKNKKVAVSLLFIFICFFALLGFNLQAFGLKMLFLMDAALLIYLCFLSTTGWELIITALVYILINVIIGRILCDSTALFINITLLYFAFNFVVFLFLQARSLKTRRSLKDIFETVKIRLVVNKLVFLIFLLNTLNLDESCNWIRPWLSTFTGQIIGLNLFFVFFEKDFEILAHRRDRRDYGRSCSPRNVSNEKEGKYLAERREGAEILGRGSSHHDRLRGKSLSRTAILVRIQFMIPVQKDFIQSKKEALRTDKQTG